MWINTTRKRRAAMLGKLFGVFALGGALLTAAVYNERTPVSTMNLNRVSDLYGVEVAGTRPWRPAGLPESIKHVSYRDSGEPYEREQPHWFDTKPNGQGDVALLDEPSRWPEP
jgi:hypothetical protein